MGSTGLGAREPRRAFLLIGGTGSLGTAMISRLRARGNFVRVVSRDEHKHVRLRQSLGSAPNIELVFGDVMERVLSGHYFHYVVFMAAMKHIDVCERSPSEAVRTNIIGLMNVLASIEALPEGARPVRTAAISTDKAVDPINAYGMSKAIAERICLATPGVPTTTLRYGNVLGSSGSLLTIAEGKYEARAPMLVTDPNMTRYLFTIEGALDLLDLGLSAEDAPSTVLVPMLRSARNGDILRYVLGDDYPMTIIGPRSGEKTHEALISTAETVTEVHGVPEDLRALGECASAVCAAGLGADRLPIESALGLFNPLALRSSENTVIERPYLDAFLERLGLLPFGRRAR